MEFDDNLKANIWKHKARYNKDTGYTPEFVESLNIISVDDFKNCSLEVQDMYVRDVISKIRTVNVFPIYRYTREGILQEIRSCFKKKIMFSGDRLRTQSYVGLTLLDFMFPNLHTIETGNSKRNNMYSRFYDDDKLAKCLNRHMKNYRFNNMRTPFFMYGRYFWQTATNFMPMRAKALCERFCKRRGTVYDFSAGYGGRMLGTLSSANEYKYIACEPNTETWVNLHRLGQYIEIVSQRSHSYEVHNIGSEDFILPKESVDFAYSCPPFYGLERYTNEATQSFVKYPKYEDWLEHYVKPTINNIYNCLKKDCFYAVILCDIYYINKKYLLRTDWDRIAISRGFVLHSIYGINSKTRKANDNNEAVYVYRKAK